MHRGQHRAQREAPLEAQGDVSENTQQRDENRERPLLGKFLADLRTDILDPMHARLQPLLCAQRRHQRVRNDFGFLAGTWGESDNHIAA